MVGSPRIADTRVTILKSCFMRFPPPAPKGEPRPPIKRMAWEYLSLEYPDNLEPTAGHEAIASAESRREGQYT